MSFNTNTLSSKAAATESAPGAVRRLNRSIETTMPAISWAGTAPSSLESATYYYKQVDEMVTLFWRAEYATAGSNNVNSTFILPVDCPIPRPFTGHGAESDWIGYPVRANYYPNSGGLPTPGDGGIYNSAGTYIVYAYSAPVAAEIVIGQVTYLTDEV